VKRLEAQLQSGLAPLRQLPIVADVRVLGGVGVVELVNSGGYLDEIGPRLAAMFLARGLLLRPLGNVVYFMPPYVITEEETAWAISQIAQVIAESAAIRR
jgi:adenosylmethionine-8-amino-7-oxononanoate aminotransferase